MSKPCPNENRTVLSILCSDHKYFKIMSTSGLIHLDHVYPDKHQYIQIRIDLSKVPNHVCPDQKPICPDQYQNSKLEPICLNKKTCLYQN